MRPFLFCSVAGLAGLLSVEPLLSSLDNHIDQCARESENTFHVNESFMRMSLLE